MATSLTVNGLRATVSWQYDNVLTIGNSSQQTSVSYTKTLANGTGADQADRIYAESGTSISASSSITRDLAGSLTDIYGNTITFARIKALYVEVTTDTAGGPVTVGGGSDGTGTNAVINWVGDVSDKVRVRNPGCLFLSSSDATGYAVTAGTADILRLTNESGAAAATVKLIVVGATA